jgi:para-nitrobenzyl esterase
VFDSVKVTTQQYGKNISLVGDSLALFMDIYEPVSDPAAKRPAIILAFGGTYISGDRTQLAFLGRLFAQHGYVVACIDYRIWPLFVLGFPDSAAIVDIAMKAMGDMRASVRYIKSQADVFRIDTNLIFVGGVSSGAITAIQVAYLDAGDQVPDFLKKVIDFNGGLEGSSGKNTMNYSSKVKGVLNLSGAIFDLNWIDPGEPVMISMHGTADNIVPYGDGIAAGLVGVKGSGVIHPVLKSKNIKETLITVPGGGHTDIYFEPQYAFFVDSFVNEAKKFLHGEICNLTSPIRHPEIVQAKIYPTPAIDYVMVESTGNRLIHSARLIDLMGRSIPLQFHQNKIDLHRNLSPGMYILELNYRGVSQREMAKVVIGD